MAVPTGDAGPFLPEVHWMPESREDASTVIPMGNLILEGEGGKLSMTNRVKSITRIYTSYIYVARDIRGGDGNEKT